MPPKKDAEDGATAAADPSFKAMTETEMKFIKVMFDNMNQRPDADWDKVASDLGLKDSKCAKERFRQMSVKHGWRDGPAAGGGGATTPRKKATANAGPKPAKVTKPKTPRKPKKTKAKEDTSEEDEAMTDLKDEEADDLRAEAQGQVLDEEENGQA